MECGIIGLGGEWIPEALWEQKVLLGTFMEEKWAQQRDRKNRRNTLKKELAGPGGRNRRSWDVYWTRGRLPSRSSAQAVCWSLHFHVCGHSDTAGNGRCRNEDGERRGKKPSFSLVQECYFAFEVGW